LNKLPRPRACLFDFDGTLADTAFTHAFAWNKAYTLVTGENMPSLSPHILHGRASSVIADTILTAAGWSQDSGSTLLSRKNEILLSLAESVPLFPGVVYILKSLTRKEIPWAIVSNAPAGFIRAVLRKHAIPVPLITAAEQSPDPKPSPSPYIETALRLGFTSREFRFLYAFEDSIPGITAAEKAGLFPVCLGEKPQKNSGLYCRSMDEFCQHYLPHLI
jgi:beta-phosphoglucomutase-like phosphatase (HAD superfamily)